MLSQSCTNPHLVILLPICLWLFLFFSVPLDNLSDILGLITKNVGRFILIFLELIGMRSKVLINDIVETSIPRSAIHPPPADYALILLA